MGNANEALFGSGSGAPAYKWGDTPGTVAQGFITNLDATQQRDLVTGELKFWPSGDKLMIALVTIATDARDPEIPEDDGQRCIWVSGRELTQAVKDAVKQAGKRELEVGGYLEVAFTGHGTAQKGFRPPRLFAASYRPPTTNAAATAALNAPQSVQEGASGTSTPDTPSQAVSGAVGAGNGPSSGGMTGMVDLSSLPPAARAIIEKQMQGQQ